jgi:hypothetical protein
MLGSSVAPRGFGLGIGSPTHVPPSRCRPQLEGLEDRIVPSYFPATTNGIHILEDQLPGGMSAAMIKFVATHIDGTEKETLDLTNQFRAINSDFTVLHYQLGTGNSPYDYIINNQWSSDWNSVTQNESWFVHQTYAGEPQTAANLASGRVGNNTGWDQADIANPAWQQYTLNQVFQNMAATGSNAWFADSFTYGIGGAGYDGTIPTRYQGTNAANAADWPGGVTWTTKLGDWAQVIENAFAEHNATFGTNYKFIPNLDARATSWEPNWYNNANGVPFIDGAFLEGFGQYTDTYDWTLSMNRGLSLTDNGKIVIMQPYPSAAPNTSAGQQQVDFFLGTYLLLKGDQTYLNIDYGGGVQYYPEYQLKLGSPTTSLQSNVSGYLWDGVYRRDFQNGFVLVNPGTTAYTLNLGGNYQQVHASGGGTMSDAQIDANNNYIGGSLSYQSVSSVTLAGGTAAIFLNPTTVSGVTVNDGSVQRSEVRSLTVTFSGPVTFAGGNATSAFQLTHDSDGINVGLATNVATNGSGQTVVTLTFSGSETDSVSGANGGQLSLADGRYSLTILSSNVTGSTGLALDGDGNGTAGGNYLSPNDSLGGGTGQLHLYRLFGDANGDGIVDQLDLGLFRSAFNARAGDPAYLSYLDADNSGVVDQLDLGQFRVRFNQNVFGM